MIKCGNCDNEVKRCDRNGCKNIFKKGSTIIARTTEMNISVQRIVS